MVTKNINPHFSCYPMSAKCWANVGKMLGQFRQNVGPMSRKCWANVGKMLGQMSGNVGPMSGNVGMGINLWRENGLDFFRDNFTEIITL